MPDENLLSEAQPAVGDAMEDLPTQLGPYPNGDPNPARGDYLLAALFGFIAAGSAAAAIAAFPSTTGDGLHGSLGSVSLWALSVVVAVFAGMLMVMHLVLATAAKVEQRWQRADQRFANPVTPKDDNA